ncbi:MAG: hypothetical protein AB7N80_08395 [Bdellovibrionales bacterium]
MAKTNQPVQIKKVSPYPFTAALEGEGKKMNLQIRKLTMQGFIAQLPQGFVKVGEEYKTQMELPVMAHWVVSMVKVIKTYDQFQSKDNPATKVERLAEFHFLNLSDDHKGNINRFLTAIRQV